MKNYNEKLMSKKKYTFSICLVLEIKRIEVDERAVVEIFISGYRTTNL